MRQHARGIASVVMAALAAGTLQAAQIFSESFESPDVTGTTTTGPTGWTKYGHPNYVGLMDTNSGLFTTPYGAQGLKCYTTKSESGWARAETTSSILSDTLQVGTTYRLSFNVADGARTTAGGAEYRAEIAAVSSGGAYTIIGHASGDNDQTTDMSDARELVVTSDSSCSAAIGQRLVIRIGHDWAYSGAYQNVPIFDNVALSASPAPAEAIIFTYGGASGISASAASPFITVDEALTSLTLVWDTSDKGTLSTANWAGSTSATSQGPGSVSLNIASGLVGDTVYTFRFYGETALTNAWSGAHTFPTALTANQTPVFSSIAASSSRAFLSWQDLANTETAYVLQRATAVQGPYANLATLAANTRSYLDTGLAVSTAYYYRLWATNSVNQSGTDPAACQISATTLAAAPAITISSSAPVVDGSDIALLSGATSTDKCWTDTPNHGQTFTTGSNGAFLRAFSFRTSSPGLATKTYSIRVGRVDNTTGAFVTTFIDLGQQVVSMAANDYITVTFAKPIWLEPETVYGVDMEMTYSSTAYQTGIPYLWYVNSNAYAAGRRYTRDDGNPAGVSLQSNDRIFHVDLSDPTPGGTFIILK